MALRHPVNPSPRAHFDGIEVRRRIIGVSIAQLCRRADMSEATYHKLKRGYTRQPAYRTVSRLIAALNQLEGAT